MAMYLWLLLCGCGHVLAFPCDLNYEKIKTNTENKIKHGKLQDDKIDVEIPIKIFSRYTYVNTTAINSYMLVLG